MPPPPDYRLTAAAYAAFGDDPPQRLPLFRFIEREQDAGRTAAGRNPAAYSRLIRRRAVRIDFARAVAAYVAGRPRAVPQAVRELLGGVDRGTAFDRATAFDRLFEPVPVHEAAGLGAGEEPTFSPSGLLPGVAGVATETLVRMADPDWLTGGGAVYPDDAAGPDELVRSLYTHAGYGARGRDRRRGRRVSVEDAFEAGRAELADDPDWHRENCRRITAVTPDAFRYALDAAGRRVGASAAVPVSAAAFEATARGGRGPMDYADDEFRPRGNDLIVYVLTEVYDGGSAAGAWERRSRMLSGLMLQLALLLDPSDRRPVRAISYAVDSDNTQRLRRCGFRAVRAFDGPRVSRGEVVTWDAAGRPFLERHLMLSLNDLLWAVRRAVDERGV